MKPALAEAPMRRRPNASLAWRLLITPPLSGVDNMAFDREILRQVSAGVLGPTLRFFQWRQPAISYGRLQRPEAIAALIPEGWEAVQRPTGGGLVRHGGDLCLSLCWRAGQRPLPAQLRQHYEWIHRLVQEALAPVDRLAMARCTDCAAPAQPFERRQCFTEPVVFDLLSRGRKVVGGALCRQGPAFLYQGSIQGYSPARILGPLQQAFAKRLNIR